MSSYHMTANPDKCHLLVKNNTLTSVNVNGFQITNSTEEKLLCLNFDSKFSFENYVSSICKKGRRKLQAPTRSVNYINLSKQKALMKTFVISHFKYCLLVWMFHSRKLNLNSIRERMLRNTYRDYKSTFLELLQKDNSLTVH